MKRYKLKIRSMSVDTFTQCLSTMQLPDPEAIEDPDGEWVKYEDVCDLLNNLGHSVSVVGFHDRIKRLETHLQPGIKTPECNCLEMTKHKPASLSKNNLFGDSLLPQSPDHWICPAHGYKKR